MENNKIQGKMPEIYCCIIVHYDKADKDDYRILEEIKKIGVYVEKILETKDKSNIDIEIAVVYYENFWYLHDALTKMFSQVDDHLSELKAIVDKYKAEVIIDIAFYQYGTYPALEFSGANMQKIHLLNADISIDPYDMSEDN